MSLLLILGLVSLVSHPLVRMFGRLIFVVLAVVLAGAFAVILALSQSAFSGGTRSEAVEWIPQLGMTLTLRLDAVSAVFALLITGAGALVLLYCTTYFEEGEAGLPRFAYTFMGFATSMLGLVLSDDVYLLFIFWESTTVFSFLLIGHVTRLRTARASALQAFMVTTLGGLAMLVGFVLLAQASGSSLLSDILADPPRGALATTAVFLVLAGALSKSAIFPFHFWLPGAMTAPTPVSAYLHAAAMVKAGVYLIARLAPGFGDVAGYRETIVLLGAVTMLNGGYRALKQFDIKLIVAHSTVSQLGLLVLVLGLGDPRAIFAGLAMTIAHALAKAPLFLAVGIIDHTFGSRDLRRLSGVGRKMPVLAIVTTVAAASLAGVPPLIGFVAKESVLAELLELGTTSPVAEVALLVVVLGSVLTVAYMGRFLWGAFADKHGCAEAAVMHKPGWLICVPPTIFVLLTIVGGVFAAGWDPVLQSTVAPIAGAAPEHLALWHGLTPALMISLGILTVGAVIAVALSRTTKQLPSAPDRTSGSHAYWVVTHWLDSAAVRLTSLTQRGSLPFYLAVILLMLVVTLGGTLLVTGQWPDELVLVTAPVQVPIAIVMIIAAVYSLRARTRFQSVVLVGVTGYGMAAIFAMHGAPDLALTQALVETVTLIAVVLVIRRLPQRFGLSKNVKSRRRLPRAIIGVSVGLVLGTLAVVALGERIADPISLDIPELAYAGGHGKNAVNVMLVDMRGWDTLGELSVILAAATGVASLVFLSTRADLRPKISRRDARTQVREHLMRVADPEDPARRGSWVLAGRFLQPESRSILLEVVVRLLFHGLIILSVYLLLTGHNTPGGGFAGGLVAGLALVARYLAGGRHELRATVPLDAGRILGVGLALAVSMAVLPMFFGQSALASAWIDLDLGPFGVVPLVTSTLFDVGVYLVVFGLILDVLRSLGAEIDEQEEADEAAFEEEVLPR